MADGIDWNALDWKTAEQLLYNNNGKSKFALSHGFKWIPGVEGESHGRWEGGNSAGWLGKMSEGVAADYSNNPVMFMAKAAGLGSIATGLGGAGALGETLGGTSAAGPTGGQFNFDPVSGTGSVIGSSAAGGGAASVLGDIAGSKAAAIIAGGLLGAKAGEDTTTTSSKDPWGPAQQYLKDNLATNAAMQKHYQANPFSTEQKAAYQNMANVLANNQANVPNFNQIASNFMGSKGGRMAPMPGLLSGTQAPAIDFDQYKNIGLLKG